MLFTLVFMDIPEEVRSFFFLQKIEEIMIREM